MRPVPDHAKPAGQAKASRPNPILNSQKISPLPSPYTPIPPPRSRAQFNTEHQLIPHCITNQTRSSPGRVQRDGSGVWRAGTAASTQRIRGDLGVRRTRRRRATAQAPAHVPTAQPRQPATARRGIPLPSPHHLQTRSAQRFKMVAGATFRRFPLFTAG